MVRLFLKHSLCSTNGPKSEQQGAEGAGKALRGAEPFDFGGKSSSRYTSPVMSPKYPRTAHLPYSPGGTSDDRRVESVASFLGTSLVLTEKMDGSNVCLESEVVFARSHASAPNHPSFNALKAMHAGLKGRIPAGIQVFGEWLFAKHSIAYNELPSYLMVFGVRDLTNGVWASWTEVEMWAEELGVTTVPVLAREESITRASKLQTLVESMAAMPSRCGGAREGLVVRKAGEFKDEAFATSVVKWVRKGHVQTADHWKTQEIIRNVTV